MMLLLFCHWVSGGNNLHVLLVAERELQPDLTLQLFANSILSNSAVVLKGLAAFRQHAAADVDMTRAQVQAATATAATL